MNGPAVVRTATATNRRRVQAEARRRARVVLERAGFTVDEMADAMRTTPDAVRRDLRRDREIPW